MIFLLTRFLIDKFIPNKNDIINIDVRSKYGYLGGYVGIFANIFLFITKTILGLIINSISLVADGINNLSDVGSSGITLLGFKLSKKPADKEHPFGHGRTEYIAALIVSLIIIMVGFELLHNSIKRIINPEKVTYSLLSIYILVTTILIKLWMGFFNRKLAKIIDSKSLAASAVDSFSDVFATSCVALSIIFSPYLSFPIDAYMGVIVAIVIMYSGLSIAKNTLDPLLGKAPNPELVENIKKTVLHFDGIEGIHDLIIHDYGPNRKMATLHAEVSDQLSSIVAHDIIDAAEKKVEKKFNVILVIHIDPLQFECEDTSEIYQKVKNILSSFPSFISFHDFRIIQAKNKDNIIFEVVVEEKLRDDEVISLKDNMKSRLKTEFPNYDFFITMEREHAYFH